jgi:hypothetical protein
LKLPSFARTPVLKAGPEVNPIDFDRPMEKPDGCALEVPDGPSELEEEPVDSKVGDVHTLGDVVIDESELELVEQLVNLEEAEPLAGQGSAREEGEPLPAPFPRPPAILQPQELPCIAALGTSGARPK